MDVKFESTLKHTEIIPNFDTCDVFSILFLLPEFLFSAGDSLQEVFTHLDHFHICCYKVEWI